MIQLYYGSGARDFEIVGSPPLTDQKFNEIKTAAQRLLRARGWSDACDALQSFQWELSAGINVFGDEFHILHSTVEIEKYVELSEKFSSPFSKSPFAAIANTFSELGFFVRFVALFPSTKESMAVVPAPTPKTTSSTVEEALKDAQTLLQSSGAMNAVDRIHTAMHAYLQEVCTEASIPFPADANITFLFGAIRDNHPKFLSARSGDSDSIRMLRSFAGILEALNNLRNHRTLAHPNQYLLDEPEAILAINSVRTLLHYFDAKLRNRLS